MSWLVSTRGDTTDGYFCFEQRFKALAPVLGKTFRSWNQYTKHWKNASPFFFWFVMGISKVEMKKGALQKERKMAGRV